jgi:hypothetical protein
MFQRLEAGKAGANRLVSQSRSRQRRRSSAASIDRSVSVCSHYIGKSLPDRDMVAEVAKSSRSSLKLEYRPVVNAIASKRDA